ncbi:uncharacterized protein Z520_02124 [Fonsecaea multimorphosa CBS 102226]|uniref:Uncharacterized protein n=1 Tax=Fonsecaea multimorphosa CBS 102226 TaxID=1442371 RepID=A0A0D2HJC5_9EURO|nr:uncharacterized protein Z520_02124 [Fonsecaea multimorphosa CBS 102226]KIY01986.1 hypothetical protein Z520_02124 [Fonsecaea multimorphosa CBS 102226]OAL29668.1 hypothetical protein AYO22_02082 [Fonsecaea multimorphosa]
MFAITLIAASLTVVSAVHWSSLRDAQQLPKPAAILTAPPTATASLSVLPDGITADPEELRRRDQTHTLETVYTYETLVQGGYTWLSTLGSLCGFVTGDIHWALYCDQGQYCFTNGAVLQCCSTTAESYWTSTAYYTATDTDRNTLTTTSVSTGLEPVSEAYGSNCTAMASTCYNYNATASCTGSCTSTALVCNDPYFPYCASIYSGGYSPSAVGTSTAYLPEQYGLSYFCDTAAYGLVYGNTGDWPSVTSTYLSTVNYATSTAPTFTPNVVPYSRTQASRPASQAILGPTSTTSTATSSRILAPAAEMLAVVSLLALGYLLA